MWRYIGSMNITDPITFGTAVRLAREAVGATQKDVADDLSTTQGRISRLEKGASGEISLTFALAVASRVGLVLSSGPVVPSVPAPTTVDPDDDLYAVDIETDVLGGPGFGP